MQLCLHDRASRSERAPQPTGHRGRRLGPRGGVLLHGDRGRGAHGVRLRSPKLQDGRPQSRGPPRHGSSGARGPGKTKAQISLTDPEAVRVRAPAPASEGRRTATEPPVVELAKSAHFFPINGKRVRDVRICQRHIVWDKDLTDLTGRSYFEISFGNSGSKEVYDILVITVIELPVFWP